MSPGSTIAVPGACRATLLTPPRPGAIACIGLDGPPASIVAVLDPVAAGPIPAVGSVRLRTLRDPAATGAPPSPSPPSIDDADDHGSIDEVLLARPREETILICPHGGPRIVGRILEALRTAGATVETDSSARPGPVDFPEAADRAEAFALAALARAASPRAIDLLLDQPDRWRRVLDGAAEITSEDRARSVRLGRLLDPPSVVLAGPPNVGKSTLSNHLLGRTMSIAIDRPGTTRDWVSSTIEIDGLVVRWHDTPGLRRGGDELEAESIRAAEPLLRAADLLIAITDVDDDWPRLHRPPDLRLSGRCDLGHRTDADLAISTVTGEGLDVLARLVRSALVPDADLEHPGPWVFDPRLEPDRAVDER